MTPVVWHGCYDANWRELIVPAAFAHPAKMSRALLIRIYDELFQIGAIHPGSVIVDPFGGIGTTAIEGAARGCRVICNELEAKFVALARENFALHEQDWLAMGRPLPIMVNGDSRKLRESIGSDVSAMATISSPPYEGNSKSDYLMSADGKTRARDERREHQQGKGCFRGSETYGDTEGQLGRLSGGSVESVISSPPYAEGHSKGHPSLGSVNKDDWGSEGTDIAGRRNVTGSYGKTEGQIADLPSGSIEAIVSSPPYAEIASGAGGLNTKPAKDGQQGGRSSTTASQDTDQRYGSSAGQLAKLPKGDVDGIVSSPPFLDARSNTTSSVKGSTPTLHDPEAMGFSEGNLNAMPTGNTDGIIGSPPWENGADGTIRAEKFKDPLAFARSMSAADGHGSRNGTTVELRLAQMERSAGSTYGESPEQLGNQKGETFWSAALLIVQESFAILKPGGVAVWVVKAFVRDKQLVDFPGDWRKLCEHVGFETFQEVHASLVAEEEIPDLFEVAGSRTKRRERKSFFRRLAEKKGAPRIDHEVVLFMVKR